MVRMPSHLRQLRRACVICCVLSRVWSSSIGGEIVAVRNQEGRVLGVIAEYVFRARGGRGEI